MNRIDVLPDEVLLEIFDFYFSMDPSYENKWKIEPWQLLVHVCRRWRILIFESPRRLNLRIPCTPKTPTRDKLDIWPALPIVVTGRPHGLSETDNIIAALEQSNRVCQVFLLRPVHSVLAAMQVPFPELTDLHLLSYDETPPVIPDSFLGGSAQSLECFFLSRIPFPGLPTLLLSATHLVDLWLEDIPHSGYISPEAMVALLSVLSSLKILSLEFRSLRSRPDRETQSLPPCKHSILPTLCEFCFKGVTEYLEDFVAIIDAPQLEILKITLFNQIDFDTQRLAQFINRTPKLDKCDEAHVELTYARARVLFGTLEISITCREPVLSVAQVCNSALPSSVEDLYIEHPHPILRPLWQDGSIENTLWLQLLLPFTAVKNLYLSEEFAPGIAAALQELVGARITEVLPSMQNIFVRELEPSGPFQENIQHFVVARQHSNHPIGISVWNKDSNMKPT
jgi:hypothetical protein